MDTHSCLDPGVPVNGIRYGQDLAIGSVVWFGCEPGYRLSHEEQLVCEKNHWWSHPLPTCDGKLSSQLHVSIRLINAAHLNGSLIFTFTTISRIFSSVLIEVWLYMHIIILITFNSDCKRTFHLKCNFSDSRRHQFRINPVLLNLKSV